MQGLFDYASIEINKQGKKSEKQIKEIKEAVNPMTWLMGGLGILVLGGCFYGVLATLAGGGGGVIDIFIWILGLAGLVALLRGLVIWNLRRQLLAEPVQAEEGRVKYVTTSALSLATQGYSAETFDAKKLHPLGLAGTDPKLPPGDYRFYFLKPRAWLLSAEPLFDEAEMRAAVNELLASALGYDQAHLENCRLEAKLGQVKAVEGVPNIEIIGGSTDVNDEHYQSPDYFFRLGDLRVQTTSAITPFIYDNLPYRAYYRTEPANQLVALEVA